MAFNDQAFRLIFQCFTHFQFVYTARNEFDMYVYQRASDLAKLEDDLAFFSKVLSYFEKGTKEKVTKIVVVFGHVHFEEQGNTYV